MTSETMTIHRTLDTRQFDVRTRILKAARRLIQQHGHEAVGMEMIAKAARVSRASMYRYFASKEHVVCEAALAWGADVARRLPEALAAAPTPAAALDMAIQKIVAEANSDLPMVRATMASVLATGPVADEFRRGVRHMFQSLMAGAIPALPEPPESLTVPLTLLGRVFFADLALMGAGDIDASQCVTELQFAARRLLIDTHSNNLGE